jgi:hypothetical protein
LRLLLLLQLCANQSLLVWLLHRWHAFHAWHWLLLLLQLLLTWRATREAWRWHALRRHQLACKRQNSSAGSNASLL